jgi:hypothetical protein
MALSTSLPPRPEGVQITAAELISAGSLSVALDRLVFAHPEVLTLRAAAIEASTRNGWPFYEFANLITDVIGLEVPVLPLRHFNDRRDDFGRPEVQRVMAKPSAEWEALCRSAPIEITACYGAFERRAHEFFNLLQNGLVAARGHVADGHLVDIAQSLWLHERYYIHCPTGDLYEAGTERLVKRYTAVVLVAPPSLNGRLDVSREHPGVLPVTLAPDLNVDALSAGHVTKATAAGKARLETYNLCLQWLSAEMRRSRDLRERPKAFWFRQAQTKWRIAKRSFERAWDQAIRDTNAIAWAKAGPPKRPHRNPRID